MPRPVSVRREPTSSCPTWRSPAIAADRRQMGAGWAARPAGLSLSEQHLSPRTRNPGSHALAEQSSVCGSPDQHPNGVCTPGSLERDECKRRAARTGVVPGPAQSPARRPIGQAPRSPGAVGGAAGDPVAPIAAPSKLPPADVQAASARVVTRPVMSRPARGQWVATSGFRLAEHPPANERCPIPASSGQTSRHRLEPRRQPPAQSGPPHGCPRPVGARPRQCGFRPEPGAPVAGQPHGCRPPLGWRVLCHRTELARHRPWSPDKWWPNRRPVGEGIWPSAEPRTRAPNGPQLDDSPGRRGYRGPSRFGNLPLWETFLWRIMRLCGATSRPEP
jgi:hypothetical protein